MLCHRNVSAEQVKEENVSRSLSLNNAALRYLMLFFLIGLKEFFLRIIMILSEIRAA